MCTRSLKVLQSALRTFRGSFKNHKGFHIRDKRGTLLAPFFSKSVVQSFTQLTKVYTNPLGLHNEIKHDLILRSNLLFHVAITFFIEQPPFCETHIFPDASLYYLASTSINKFAHTNNIVLYTINDHLVQKTPNIILTSKVRRLIDST